jgi:hypothetical protein
MAWATGCHALWSQSLKADPKGEMMKQIGIGDTSPEARKVHLEVYRRMPIGEKWLRLGEMFRMGRILAEAGYRARHPNATDDDVLDNWFALTLEPDLLQAVRASIRTFSIAVHAVIRPRCGQGSMPTEKSLLKQ